MFSTRDSGSRMQSKIEVENKKRFCLVAYGYAMKDSKEEREIALRVAVKEHGVPVVLDRLEFLKEAWSGTPMFLKVIGQDMQFVLSFCESNDPPVF